MHRALVNPEVTSCLHDGLVGLKSQFDGSFFDRQGTVVELCGLQRPILLMYDGCKIMKTDGTLPKAKTQSL